MTVTLITRDVDFEVDGERQGYLHMLPLVQHSPYTNTPFLFTGRGV